MSERGGKKNVLGAREIVGSEKYLVKELEKRGRGCWERGHKSRNHRLVVQERRSEDHMMFKDLMVPVN